MTIGSLVWWSIPDAASLSTSALSQLVGELALNAPGVSRPPVDTFRRLSSSASTAYELDDAHITLDLRTVPSQSTMLVRHVVRSERRDGTLVSARRVGDFAFYKPPRDQPERARVRATPMPGDLPDREQIESFVKSLRVAYKDALRTIDSQALRRTVRAFLRNADATYMDGPYFVPNEEDAERLSKLLDSVEGCVSWHLGVLDDERTRLMLAQAGRSLAAEKEKTDVC
jgi:hypothetical protein